MSARESFLTVSEIVGAFALLGVAVLICCLLPEQWRGLSTSWRVVALAAVLVCGDLGLFLFAIAGTPAGGAS